MNANGRDSKKTRGSGAAVKRNQLDGSDQLLKRRRFLDDNIQEEAPKVEDAFIFKLFDDDLIKIIAMIPMAQWPSLETVNRRFQQVVFRAWHSVREIHLEEEFRFKSCLPGLANSGQIILEGVLKKLLRRAPYISSIGGISGVLNGDSLRLSTISHLADFQRLESINLAEFKIEVKNLNILLQASASLKDLDISNCQLDSFCFFAKNMNSWQEFNASSLKSVNVVDSLDRNRFEPVGMISLISRCDNVERLGFGRSHISAEAYTSLMGTVVAFRQLSSLTINDVGNGPVTKRFRIAVVDMIRKLGQDGHLREFALRHSVIDDLVITEIAENLQDLTSLEVGTEKCSSESVLRLVTQLKKLENLQLRSLYFENHAIDCSVMHALVANVRGLRRLRIDCPSCDSKEFDVLADLEQLVEIRLRYLYIIASTMEKWGNAGFAPRLQVIELGSSDQLQEASAVLLINKLPLLRQLILRNGTDDVLRAVASSCKFIREVILDGPRMITAEGIQSFIDDCPCLKYFSVPIYNHDHYDKLKVGKYRKIIFGRSPGTGI